MNAQERFVRGSLMWLAAGLILLLSLWTPARVHAEGAAVTCASFDSLPVGTEYASGDKFVSDGISFVVGNGGGVVQVDPGGQAGGSGRELEIRNVDLLIDFAAMPGTAPVDAISFRYGEYGGYVKLGANNVVEQREQFSLLDGEVVGGAAVSVNSAGINPEMGAVATAGTINSFGLHGQELWIDTLCIRKGQTADPEPGLRPDLGDAPDSTNHVGIPNTAYPAVQGRFPTVWQGTPPGAGTGPKHRNASAEGWLGNGITPEVDADPPAADSDGANNILNGSNDNADNDRFDDGWRNRLVPMPNCAPTTLITRIRRGPAATLPVMYLNVWIDGNSDGDWQDSAPCPTVEGSPWGGAASEWIVRNRPIVMGAIPPGGFLDIPTTTSPVLNTAASKLSWMRFTLAEMPVFPPAPGAQPDGRGPDFPLSYAFGETEDILRKPAQAGTPGTLQIQKTQEGTENGSVQAGATFTYTIRLRHDGGTALAETVMVDPLPSGVQIAGPIRVVEEVPQVAPLAAVFADGSVRWRGSLLPGAVIRFEVPVRATRCIGQPLQVTNTARVRQTDGTSNTVSVQTTIVCGPGNPPVVVKRILEARGGSMVEVLESDIVPGSNATFRFKASNPTNRAVIVRLRDPLPDGLVTAGGGAPSDLIVRTFAVPPNGSASVDVPVRLVRRAEGEQALVNVARYVSCFAVAPNDLCSFPTHNDPLVQATNAVTLTVKGRDLGDAPDSTNHFAAGMAAYPAVPATYPTVFDLANLPVGPAHVQPQLFHLGFLVSREANADVGPDADGINNIVPPANLANRDRQDDGVNVLAIPFAECRRFEFKVRVAIAPAAIALLQNGTGYLNAWVDGTRDGDWADFTPCPATPQFPNGSIGLEHFVIDFPINAAALGPGVHVVTVQSTHPVYWPAADANKPAWVRLTLSDSPAAKPLTAGTVSYGDGRGPLPPFRLGETEDYLRRAQQDPTSGADVAVRKRGVVVPVIRNQGQGQNGAESVAYRVHWAIDYRNVGDANALFVKLEDVIVSSYDFASLRVRSVPELPMQRDGDTLTFDVGSLAPGSGGRIFITAEVPAASVGLPQVNRVRATAQNDGNPGNNEVEATATLALPAPLIVEPRSGDTSETQVHVAGRALPGAEVDLWVDDVKIHTEVARDQGIWDHDLDLPAGAHEIYAQARLGTVLSEIGNRVQLDVDPTLAFDPQSLRVIDARGRVSLAVGDATGIHASGWTLLLPYVEQNSAAADAESVAANGPYTLSLRLNNGAGVTMLMEEEGISYFCGAGAGGSKGIIAILIGLICVPDNTPSPVVLQFVNQGGMQEYEGRLARMPQHRVRDAVSGDPIPGAQIEVHTAWDLAANPKAAVSVASGAPGLIERIQTDTQGRYSFGATQTGSFLLQVSKPGYQTLRVAAGDVNGDILMLPEVGDEVALDVHITDEGFEPPLATVMAGTKVRFTNIDLWEHGFMVEISGVNAGLASAAGAGAQPALVVASLEPGESLVLPAGSAMTASDSGNPDATSSVISSPFGEQPVFLPIVGN